MAVMLAITGMFGVQGLDTPQIHSSLPSKPLLDALCVSQKRAGAVMLEDVVLKPKSFQRRADLL